MDQRDFQTVNQQIDTQQLTIQGGYAWNGNGFLNRTLICWKITGNDQNNIYDWYLFQDDVTSSVLVNSTLYLDGIDFEYTLLDADDTALPKSTAMLQESQPSTTPMNETISSSLSTTFSVSGGFFGDTPTASVGASVTMGSSTSRTITGVAVRNESLRNTGNDAKFCYDIAEFSTSQGANTDMTNQMLFRVNRTAAPKGVKLKVVITVRVSDHDGEHGTHYFDSFAHSNVFTTDNVNTITGITYTNDRIGYFDFLPISSPVVDVPTPGF